MKFVDKLSWAFMLVMLLGGFLLATWRDESSRHLLPLVAVEVVGIGIVSYFYMVGLSEQQE